MLVSWARNEIIWSWDLHHCDQHEKNIPKKDFQFRSHF